MARTRTPPPGRLDALIPWLALLVLAGRAAGSVLARLVAGLGVLGLRGVRLAARHGRASARRGIAALRRGAAAARPVLAREVWPRVVVAATILAGLTVLVVARVGESAEQALTVAGIHLDRVLATLGDVVAVVATVLAPRAWRWTTRVGAPRAWHRVAGVWGPAAWRATAAVVPVLVRRGAQAGIVVAAAGLLAVPALHLVSLTVEVDDLPPLADRSVVQAGDGATLAVLHEGEERAVVPLERIPEPVQAAVLAAEDRRFADHPGYDLVAVGRATLANIRAGRITEGASTLTQQLAKQNFTGADRTTARKVRELVYAVALERRYDKDTLLERYLNQVYFGNGAYGVAVAAREYFRTEPEELTADQGALLAALIRSPSGFDPRADVEAATARRDRVLAAMVETGALTEEEHAELVARPLELYDPRKRTVLEPYLVEAVRRELLAEPALGATPDERDRLLRTGGLTIETTIDLPLQEAVAEIVAAHLPDVEGPTAAVAAVEPGTGRILALHGGRDFAASQFDLAVQARRQPGSLFKTFVAAAALEAGATPETPVAAPALATFDVGGDRWSVRNYGGRNLGSVELRTALAQSANTTFADLAVDLGTEAIVDVLDRVGIDPERALGPEASRGPSIALGGVTHGVSPLEMAAAYAVLADEGRYARPHLVERVVAPDGTVIHEADRASESVLDRRVARDLVTMLHEAVDNGTGTAARLESREVAGKTGTTQHGADAWFAGVTDDLSATVWVGHPDGRTPMGQATGGRLAAPIWRDVAREILD